MVRYRARKAQLRLKRKVRFSLKRKVELRMKRKVQCQELRVAVAVVGSQQPTWPSVLFLVIMMMMMMSSWPFVLFIVRMMMMMMTMSVAPCTFDHPNIHFFFLNQKNLVTHLMILIS